MFLVSSCSCPCPVYWSHVLSREWRCSDDRRCSNYLWVINKFMPIKVQLILEFWRWYNVIPLRNMQVELVIFDIIVTLYAFLIWIDSPRPHPLNSSGPSRTNVESIIQILSITFFPWDPIKRKWDVLFFPEYRWPQINRHKGNWIYNFMMPRLWCMYNLHLS